MPRPIRRSKQRLRAWLGAPQDPAGLAVFRALFGLVMVVAVVRTWAMGWIDSLYVAPDFHFTYLGFDWVQPLPGVGMYVVFALMGVAALCVALGVRARLAALLFFGLFTWVELIEKAAYLNHYYFVSLVALLLALTPCDRALALWPSRRARAETQVPRWSYAVVRAQVIVVYLFAGAAKLDEDWLLHAEPLHTWLQGYAHWPILGPVAGERWVAFAMSWAGALFDLTIWAWLLWRRTRVAAYVLALGFHALVGAMFPIGLFSWVMAAAATIFFAPAWPRRWLPGDAPAASVAPTPRVARPAPRWIVGLLAAWLLVQIAVPLRFVLYPGPVNWTEEGFRFAWRVMLIEKTGQLEYRVTAGSPPLRVRVSPRDGLTPQQARMVATQPDMILEYAHHLAATWRAAGYEGVEVRADAFVAFNGRPSQRLVDPDVDLAAEPRSLAHKPWILPLRER